MVLDEGNVKELAATPPPSSDRVPVTNSNRQRIDDPLTALLFSATTAGEDLTQGACLRTLPIFDGHQRYDLKLAFKSVGLGVGSKFSGRHPDEFGSIKMPSTQAQVAYSVPNWRNFVHRS